MVEEKKELSPKGLPAFLSGLLVGLAIVTLFWLGYSYYNREPQVNSVPSEKSLLKGNVERSENRLPPISARSAGIVLGEHTIADIAQKASDVVVNIDISSSVNIADSPFSPIIPFNEFFFGPGFGNGRGMPNMPHKMERKGTGSGLIYRSDGYILTNNHVVGQADDIQVTLNDKRVFKGTVIGRDSFTDLALVKINANKLPVAQLGSSKELRPGDWVIAIGNPMGLDHTVTFGIVSAIGRLLRDLNNNVELIQTDAAINPGNSGGPLLNIHGEVIGLNTAIRGDAQNIGFAIPIDTAKDIAAQLITKGSIDRPYIGIYMQELDENLARSLGISPNTKGVVVGGLAVNSPAEKSGVAQGDIIVKVDGKSINTGKEVQSIVRSHKPGDTMSIVLLRDGQMKAISVRIGKYPGPGDSE
jgi:Do/DeqQ family serine protease